MKANGEPRGCGPRDRDFKYPHTPQIYLVVCPLLWDRPPLFCSISSMDTLDDELEFQEDMAYLNKLVAQIYWRKLQGVEPDVIESWNDVKTFGAEPIFAGMVFEAMIRSQVFESTSHEADK